MTILVDTGFGTRLNPKELSIYGLDGYRAGLLDSLAAIDVRPEDVDLVLNTHLHWDHCGGNTRFEGDEVVPTFPRARYAAQRIEIADAAYPNERTAATYNAGNLAPLLAHDLVDFLDGDTRLTSRVRTIVTPGHTKSHQCVVLEPAEAPPIVFLADLAPLAIHLERVAWVPALDVLPLDSLETKRAMSHWLTETEALCVMQHDAERPVGRLRQAGRHFEFTPE
jgi:glyoxylase-like metal-dependent hydrolase (beta-lactamase superfamily II)